MQRQDVSSAPRKSALRARATSLAAGLAWGLQAALASLPAVGRLEREFNRDRSLANGPSAVH